MDWLLYEVSTEKTLLNIHENYYNEFTLAANSSHADNSSKLTILSLYHKQKQDIQIHLTMFSLCWKIMVKLDIILVIKQSLKQDFRTKTIKTYL